MTLSAAELQSLAELAYLEITGEETAKLSKEINAIMDLVHKLQDGPDTKGVQPLFHPLDTVSELRADYVTETDCSRELAEIAPVFENGFYLAPEVIATRK